MLQLLLLRHAKSSWSDPSLHDFDRPLNKRGMRDAPLMAKLMKKRGIRPDKILCSSAERTKQTLGGIVPALVGKVSLHLLDVLYEGNAPDYIDVLRNNAKHSKSLMIIGHNTGLQDCALKLIGSADKTLLKNLETKFPTASLVIIEFRQEDWKNLELKSGHLVDFIKPSDLNIDDEDFIVENPAPTFFHH